MKTSLSRRSAIRQLAAGAAVAAAASQMSSRIEAAEGALDAGLKGRINHSVCRWCYSKVPLEDLCAAGKEMGLQSIELLGPDEWPVAQKHGLTCAMASGAMGIPTGFNHVENHDELVGSFEKMIPKVADAGLTNLICFSGNRKGISDAEGLENCVTGLKRLLKLAEEKKVTLVMELLNSRVDHHDYQCDHSAWGVELCKRLGSERFKLLYDIYHMQIMEGDVIRTIKRDHQYFAHYHTGGVPGRHEIDDSQEIYYPAVMKAVIETGFKGHVAQEFIPARPDVLASLKQGVHICDV
jgi:hydroxypyruvate isomerase